MQPSCEPVWEGETEEEQTGKSSSSEGRPVIQGGALKRVSPGRISPSVKNKTNSRSVDFGEAVSRDKYVFAVGLLYLLSSPVLLLYFSLPFLSAQTLVADK